MNSCGVSKCVKTCIQIKLLLEKQNASSTNILRMDENRKHCQTAACGVDAGAYCVFSTSRCWWDGFFSVLVWRLLMHDWSSISIQLPETQGDAPDPGAFETSATVTANTESTYDIPHTFKCFKPTVQTTRQLCPNKAFTGARVLDCMVLSFLFLHVMWCLRAYVSMCMWVVGFVKAKGL